MMYEGSSAKFGGMQVWSIPTTSGAEWTLPQTNKEVLTIDSDNPALSYSIRMAYICTSRSKRERTRSPSAILEVVQSVG